MNAILPDALDDRVRVGKRTYRMRPCVFHVLHALAALEDEGLLPRDRERLAVWHLFAPPRPRDHPAAIRAALQALTAPPPYHLPGNLPRTLDLQQDAALICAAFRQLYGVDLPRESVRMDWRTFQALLSGVTDDTRLGGIMSIRAQPLPRRTAHNGEQIRELQRLKAIYALRGGAGGDSFEDGLKRMVTVLAALAD